MAQIHMLKTSDVPEIPEDISLLNDWGEISIISEEKTFVGRHIWVEGEEGAFQRWLGPLDGVWVGKGSPMLQQFEVMHIRDPK